MLFFRGDLQVDLNRDTAQVTEYEIMSDQKDALDMSLEKTRYLCKQTQCAVCCVYRNNRKNFSLVALGLMHADFH